MTTEKEKSEFAAMLERLLAEKDLYSRSDWATILNVTTSAISQWVSDSTFPRAESLRRIIQTLEEDARVSDAVLTAFDTMSRKPLEKIAPHASKPGCPTLEHYMAQPIRTAFERVIATLPPHLQEEVWLEATTLARKKRARRSQRPTVAERRRGREANAPASEATVTATEPPPSVGAAEQAAKEMPPATSLAVTLHLIQNILDVMGRNEAVHNARPIALQREVARVSPLLQALPPSAVGRGGGSAHG